MDIRADLKEIITKSLTISLKIGSITQDQYTKEMSEINKIDDLTTEQIRQVLEAYKEVKK